MSKFSAKIYIFLALWILTDPLATRALAGDEQCPKEMEELKKPTCDEKKSECQKCQAAVEKQNKKVKDYKTERQKCIANSAACEIDLKGGFTPGPGIGMFRPAAASRWAWLKSFSDLICQDAEAAVNPVDTGTQHGNRVGAVDKARNAKECFARNREAADKAEQAAQECHDKIKEACTGDAAEPGKKEAKKCLDAAKDAKKKKEQAGQKEKGAGDNEKKGEDNAKKDGGGQMPQMPQIPQQQQSQDQQPQQQADYPQATSPTPGSDNKEKQEIAESKFDEDKDKNAIPAVGFGNTTPVGTATVTSPGPSTTAQGFDSSRNPSNSNGFGDKPQAGSVAATGLPQGGGGGGGLNSSGASLPGGGQGAEGEKKANDANPYEVPVGSGGRLGAPKGKTGGESDSALDTAATSAFKDDFKADPNAGAGGADMASAGGEEDGYSIFKMVKYRYTELKKRGSI